MPKEPNHSHKIPVKDYEFTENMTVDELVKQMELAWGFTAGKLATGVNIMEAMIDDKKCVKILSFTADIIATGTRGVIRELVKRKLVDVIITTCGTLDHDVARCSRDYYKGSFMMSDSKLHQEGVNRLGNVLVPNDSYGIVIEKKILGLSRGALQRGQKRTLNNGAKPRNRAKMLLTKQASLIGQLKTKSPSLYLVQPTARSVTNSGTSAKTTKTSA